MALTCVPNNLLDCVFPANHNVLRCLNLFSSTLVSDLFYIPHAPCLPLHPCEGCWSSSRQWLLPSWEPSGCPEIKEGQTNQKRTRKGGISEIKGHKRKQGLRLSTELIANQGRENLSPHIGFWLQGMQSKHHINCQRIIGGTHRAGDLVCETEGKMKIWNPVLKIVQAGDRRPLIQGWHPSQHRALDRCLAHRPGGWPWPHSGESGPWKNILRPKAKVWFLNTRATKLHRRKWLVGWGRSLTYRSGLVGYVGLVVGPFLGTRSVCLNLEQ